MTIYPDDFEDNIRDLLVNLYDYLKLINNTLAQQLQADRAGSDRAQAVRRTILDAVDDMKSEKSAQLTSRQNRLYNILLLRYVEEQATAEVLSQLALSERQYYREHQRAIQTVSQIVWDKHFAGEPLASDETVSLIEELDHLQLAAANKGISPKEEIRRAIAATRVIAEQRDVSVELREDSDELVILHVAQPVFLQFVIYITNKLIQATESGRNIEISVRLEDSEPIIEIHSDSLARAWQTFYDRLQADNTFNELMKRLGADIESSMGSEGGTRIVLRFDHQIHKILVVDDNPDTISLFKRYLGNLPYQVLSTHDENDAMLIAQRTPLICIILDIMLPEKDGWQILQSYKSHPLTKDIPVLICSVLEMKDLALSLGADGYLKKPPTRDEFLSILSEWVS